MHKALLSTPCVNSATGTFANVARVEGTQLVVEASTGRELARVQLPAHEWAVR